jgi:hypothetical protein
LTIWRAICFSRALSGEAGAWPFWLRVSGLRFVQDAQRVHPRQRLGNAHVGDLGDVLAGHLHAQHLFLQPLAAAGFASAKAHHRLDALLDVVARALAVAAGQVGDHALKSHVILPALAQPIDIVQAQAVAVAAPVEDQIALRLAERAPGLIHWDAVGFTGGAQYLPPPCLVIVAIPADRVDRALFQREIRVGHNQRGSISRLLPSPWHSGQAPCGELKENSLGSRSG